MLISWAFTDCHTIIVITEFEQYSSDFLSPTLKAKPLVAKTNAERQKAFRERQRNDKQIKENERKRKLAQRQRKKETQSK